MGDHVPRRRRVGGRRVANRLLAQAVRPQGRGHPRRTPQAGARAVSPAVLPRLGAGRPGSASGSFRGGSPLPLATDAAVGRGSAARKKCNCVKKSSPG